MPSSSMPPRASRKAACLACRGTGSVPSTLCAMRVTAGPEMRTMPMPPRPGGVAMAAIVSRATSPARMGRLVAIEHALDLPLLEDRKDVVDQPVEHQPGREEEKEDAEHKRHEFHYLRLHRIGRRGVHARLEHHGSCHQDWQDEVRIQGGEIPDPQHERRMAQF